MLQTAWKRLVSSTLESLWGGSGPSFFQKIDLKAMPFLKLQWNLIRYECFILSHPFCSPINAMNLIQCPALSELVTLWEAVLHYSQGGSSKTLYKHQDKKGESRSHAHKQDTSLLFPTFCGLSKKWSLFSLNSWVINVPMLITELCDGNTKSDMNEVWMEMPVWESTRRNYSEWHILIPKAGPDISQTNKPGGTWYFHEDMKACTSVRPQYKWFTRGRPAQW